LKWPSGTLKPGSGRNRDGPFGEVHRAHSPGADEADRKLGSANRKEGSTIKKVSETLRAAVTAAEARGITRYRICQETGLDHSSLTRFVYEGRDARASTLDALADFFGLELQPKSKAGRKRSS
jgi:hypothetical protein